MVINSHEKRNEKPPLDITTSIIDTTSTTNEV